MTSQNLKFQRGTPVDRSIDGCWFSAVVHESFDDEYLTIEYCDDENVETNVPVDEVRLRDRECVSGASIDTYAGSIGERMKPLAGLVEDDCEARRKRIPTTVLHDTDVEVESEEKDGAIIINGSDSTLAAGGGLRALRYLRHS